MKKHIFEIKIFFFVVVEKIKIGKYQHVLKPEIF